MEKMLCYVVTANCLIEVLYIEQSSVRRSYNSGYVKLNGDVWQASWSGAHPVCFVAQTQYRPIHPFNCSEQKTRHFDTYK